MSVAIQPHIKLVSNPYHLRAALFPTIMILALSWVFVFAWLTLALWLTLNNIFWALGILLADFAFGFYLYLMSYNLYADSFRDFVLELTASEAVLNVNDRLHHKHSTQIVLLDDIKYAEYYPFQDSAMIILHAPYVDMEVPLWPLSGQGADVVDFLNGRGVNVVNVQSDDKIPD
jgi:hypothetical protein